MAGEFGVDNGSEWRGNWGKLDPDAECLSASPLFIYNEATCDEGLSVTGRKFDFDLYLMFTMTPPLDWVHTFLSVRRRNGPTSCLKWSLLGTNNTYIHSVKKSKNYTYTGWITAILLCSSGSLFLTPLVLYPSVQLWDSLPVTSKKKTKKKNIPCKWLQRSSFSWFQHIGNHSLVLCLYRYLPFVDFRCRLSLDRWFCTSPGCWYTKPKFVIPGTSAIIFSKLGCNQTIVVSAWEGSSYCPGI